LGRHPTLDSLFRRTVIIRRAVPLLAVGALFVGACGGSYGGGGETSGCTVANATAVTSSVALKGTAFVPNCAKTTVGTALTFTNQDSIVHTVTARSGQPETFDSGNLNPGLTFSHTFAIAGTYNIVCTIHESMGMTMTLFVQ